MKKILAKLVDLLLFAAAIIVGTVIGMKIWEGFLI